jgi:hypothetical protein
MRKESTLVVLGLVALSGAARAEEGVPAAVAAPPPAAVAAPPPVAVAAPPPAVDVNVVPVPVAPPAVEPQRKLVFGAAFLPMAVGKFKFSDSFTSTSTQDAFFAYGIGVSASYEVQPNLYVGFAPQVIANVQAKPNDIAYAKPMNEADLFIRVAYAHRLVDTISVYAEALPGYSLILPSDDSAISKGLVVAFGVGCQVDMTDRVFVDVGAGYQVGLQSQPEGIHQLELRTQYVRVALGGGMRF